MSAKTNQPTGQPRGRQSLMSARRVETILAAIRKGHFIENAATLAGVSKSTYNLWKRRGENEIRRVDALDAGFDAAEIVDQFLDENQKKGLQWMLDTFADPVFEQTEWPYVLFATLLAKARAEFVDKTIEDIKLIARDPMRPNWQALKWLLQTTQPDQYGDRRTIAHEGTVGGPPIQFEMPTPDQIVERLKQLQAAREEKK